MPKDTNSHAVAGEISPDALSALLADLRSSTSMEIRDDRLTRTLYASDASIYSITPDAVAFPQSVADVQAAVRACGQHQIPLTPCGAGTGLAGGAVNCGLQLDCSRHLNRILEIDPQNRTARVQPGVVLDELNAELKPHGLHFSPDVATANRATIGGMIANNSAGAHSVVVGRTCDHIRALDVVLSDGSLASWGAGESADLADFAQNCEKNLAAVIQEYADEIEAHFPKTFRRNGGYALDRLKIDNGHLNVEQLIVGSEGTLGIVVAATLNLLPLPKEQAICVVHFDDLLASLKSVTTILEHQPSAIELIDKLILDGTKENPAMQRRRWFLEGDPQALLIVEFYEEIPEKLTERLQALAADLQARLLGYAWPIITDPDQQADVWEVRKAGTGLLMSRPGDTQPYDFVDDCAVDPAHLHEYIVRLHHILADEGIERTGYYAHASVGLLHVRPALNLKTQAGVEKLRRISDRVSQLVREFSGALTGEHGEGLVRSEWIERMFGPQLVEAFRRVKATFDPQGIFNPGKIIDPLPMDANLRYGADYSSENPPTVLDFSAHGGMAGLAEMYSGIGECRKRLVGTMCPSYMATGDETHTTRARASALRVALSNRDLLAGLSDPALDEVFDLCLSCKACKTECPTGTDVAKLKAEWLHARNQRQGVPRRSRLIARSIQLAQLGCHFAPLSNLFMQSKVVRAFMEHLYGLDRRVPPPRFARQTFRQWFANRSNTSQGGTSAGGTAVSAVSGTSPGMTSLLNPQSSILNPPIVYFVDTWVNCYIPQVGQATVKVLEALGHEVIVPPTVCCGRPLISKGMLDEAKTLAEDNVEILGPYARRGIPIIGTEPSCVSVLTDELPQFVRTPAARRVAEMAVSIESFVADALQRDPDALKFKPDAGPLIFHGHCHHKALTGTGGALRVLSACTHGQAKELNTGCCGMAGAFGHEKEHYDVAKAVGEQRLFPAVRNRGDADVAVSGFSCRHHIEHHTGVAPKHVIEYVAEALE
ncbi:MAG: FAD-linked oxidase C-terminal domain-containing protein [Planctomycetota bacterium]